MEQTEFDTCRSCHVLYTGPHSCPGHDRYQGRRLAEWGNYLGAVSDSFEVTIRLEFELRCRQCGALVKTLP
ncbi:MAG: hypothetical protein Q7T05_02830, partial [Dehalococcoidia bacterium]|nr:hypothetical protein [Dehalococcoidia bacterium]